MTKQQAYNKMRRYFTQPGAELSKDKSENLCFYRKRNGKVRKCAIGCLFPDRLYTEEMENRDAQGVLARFPQLREYFGISDPYDDELADFMLDAQTAHDSSATVKGFLRKLDAAARRHGVKVATNA
jgi:hypothetical protein